MSLLFLLRCVYFVGRLYQRRSHSEIGSPLFPPYPLVTSYRYCDVSVNYTMKSNGEQMIGILSCFLIIFSSRMNTLTLGKSQIDPYRNYEVLMNAPKSSVVYSSRSSLNFLSFYVPVKDYFSGYVFLKLFQVATVQSSVERKCLRAIISSDHLVLSISDTELFL